LYEELGSDFKNMLVMVLVMCGIRFFADIL
jgi:hypothetical protein